ncbi:unnamed protein product [Phyllotreta striolata]|uniref:Uncharacterized protein n=1 Tax=Phyllotreta striolata TaxID=444603 RepID=A0A9N9XRC7_PHYSR|nr:unnamed protein product [Phyllotreta striolata]
MSKPATSDKPCKSQAPEEKKSSIPEPIMVAPWRSLPDDYMEKHGPCAHLDKKKESGHIIIPTKYKPKPDPPPPPQECECYKQEKTRVAPWRSVPPGMDKRCGPK